MNYSVTVVREFLDDCVYETVSFRCEETANRVYNYMCRLASNPDELISEVLLEIAGGIEKSKKF